MAKNKETEMVRYLSFVLLLLLFSCTNPSLDLIGNISAETAISKSDNLQKILQESAPKAEYALIIGKDGTAVLITENSFSHLILQISNGCWNSSAADLPPVCNIKDIAAICIYQPEFTDSINSFSSILERFEFLGESSKAGHFVRKYKREIQ